RLRAAKAVNTLTGELSLYRGKMFIDCTGDGWVGYYAGARYRFGRESRDEFGESLAPEKPDHITMSGCLMGSGAVAFRARDVGHPVEYTPPPWAPRFKSAEDFGRRVQRVTGGEWWIEHPGDIDDLNDAERARDELLRITFGYWDFIKNVWPGRERARNYALVYVPILDARRESRRLVGDYILRQQDAQEGRVFADRISYGGWPLDVHHPRGIFSGKEGPFYCDPHVPIYTIPYRCLYSANIENLLMAGRDVSVTHIALGTVRVQGTLATLGQAAGTAAALALRHKTTPRGIYQHYIGELQQTLLKYDQYIPGIVNEDPQDLARKAKVTASSEARYEEFGRQQVRPRGEHPLNMARAVMFPAGERRRVDAVYVLLKSEKATPTALTLHLREAERPGDFSSDKDIATAEATVPPKTTQWVRFEVNCKTRAPFVWAWLPAAEGISWQLMTTAPQGSCRAYGDGHQWTVVKGQYYAFYTAPPLAQPADYRAANALNGVARIVGEHSNLWASDASQPMPQWIELDFGRPVELNTVYLTFDTNMNPRFWDEPLVPECVRDYEVVVQQGDKWVSVAKVTGNFQRWRRHQFPAVTTTRLRLVVHATNGAPSARVFEIRAYKE
ncbi:MAG: FAD-dependent oxidoreductase, partial [Armatimonadetes bacterium]|nr:FAD-dependent oxidoreductase [Armatimonadota bacterium]